MEDKFKNLYHTAKEIGIYILDLLFAFGISTISVSDVAHEFLRVLGGIAITMIGGSCLFILQKTFLPLFTKWLNARIEKWFNVGTKIDDKD